MGGDAWQITHPASQYPGQYWPNQIGTSYMAPQVSAAVAILAEAFPNMTPEQWTDRLLASANNSLGSGFAHVGFVSFGNGVKHGYSTKGGHGILDVYAALRPITSDSYSQSLYAGSQNLSGQRYELKNTGLSQSVSFGDALHTALSDVQNYSYDALGGGFKYNMEGHLTPLEKKSNPINIESEVNSISIPYNIKFDNKFKYFQKNLRNKMY